MKGWKKVLLVLAFVYLIVAFVFTFIFYQNVLCSMNCGNDSDCGCNLVFFFQILIFVGLPSWVIFFILFVTVFFQKKSIV